MVNAQVSSMEALKKKKLRKMHMFIELMEIIYTPKYYNHQGISELYRFSEGLQLHISSTNIFFSFVRSNPHHRTSKERD